MARTSKSSTPTDILLEEQEQLEGNIESEEFNPFAGDGLRYAKASELCKNATPFYIEEVNFFKDQEYTIAGATGIRDEWELIIYVKGIGRQKLSMTDNEKRHATLETAMNGILEGKSLPAFILVKSGQAHYFNRAEDQFEIPQGKQLV